MTRFESCELIVRWEPGKLARKKKMIKSSIAITVNEYATWLQSLDVPYEIRRDLTGVYLIKSDEGALSDAVRRRRT